MLSNTVMCGNSARSWNTMPSPRSPASVWVTTRSPITTSPAVGSTSPEIMLSVVVLPQPDGPTRIRNSPSRISRSMPLTAAKLPNSLTRSLSTIPATGRSFLVRRGQRRIMPKLKPFTRCFWMKMPRMTTGTVITVPIAACGP